MCEICDKPQVDDRGFCAVHLARWLEYASTMVYRHATSEGVREWFIAWQKEEQ